MDFVKMHGLGNDFIVVRSPEVPADAGELAVRLCDRHFGIGADGLVYILPSASADAMMRIFNADGSEAEQCGNAIRCAAKFVWEQGGFESDELTIETKGAGVQPVRVFTEGGKVVRVRVDMGAPMLDGLRIPTTIDESPVVNRPIEADGRRFTFTAVSMGNPHCVIPVDDAAQFPVDVWGPLLEKHEWFPKRTNVEFVTVRSRTAADMRVWERGAGQTLACGTGACAVLVAGVLNGTMERAGTVSLKGGDLSIEWDEETGRVYMTGAADEVFRGRVAS
ncbi:diaminopimelate epimerase [Paenibacillus thermotolerans]|uniref:diaminopimelate epimerase n=1 Tax=Paenibacillus thermotolerans TaxID=3027807 RepID=UPI0023682526|nr:MULTISPECIES: diaminopimelate epimerase [unclassified Paenibacillus]